jgi:hypothetical protein
MRKWIGVALIVVAMVVVFVGAMKNADSFAVQLVWVAVGGGIATMGFHLIPKSKLSEQWRYASREGELIVRAATRLKTTATSYKYAIDVEFEVPDVAAPPGRYEISVGHGRERHLAVGNRIRVTVLEYEGRLLVRAHLQPKSPDPRARDYYVDLTPIGATGG